MPRKLVRPTVLFAVLGLALSACGPRKPAAAPVPAETKTESAAADARPEAVNGWREYPLREGVISIRPGKWRNDVIDIPVPAGDDLEYKLEMKAGEGIVYAISYGDLQHPGLMVVEFHGHTEKGADGTGDLMYYSKTGGAAENGVFVAPWDGIHGWYLKNDSGNAVTARLEIAGFYERMDQ